MCTGTVLERIVSKVGDGIWNCQVSQGSVSLERPPFNTGQHIGLVLDVAEGSATRERGVAYAFDLGRDRYGLQT